MENRGRAIEKHRGVEARMSYGRMIAVCVVTALICVAPCSSKSPAPTRRLSTHGIREVDALVEADRRKLHLPGVSMAIMRGHRLVLAKGYGVADHEAGASATARTIYAIGSLSKQFTAAAIMKLYEEGQLQLDEILAAAAHHAAKQSQACHSLPSPFIAR